MHLALTLFELKLKFLKSDQMFHISNLVYFDICTCMQCARFKQYANAHCKKIFFEVVNKTDLVYLKKKYYFRLSTSKF